MHKSKCTTCNTSSFCLQFLLHYSFYPYQYKCQKGFWSNFQAKHINEKKIQRIELAQTLSYSVGGQHRRKSEGSPHSCILLPNTLLAQKENVQQQRSHCVSMFSWKTCGVVGVGGCGNRPPIRMGTKRCQHVTGVRPFPRPLHSFLLLTPTQTQQWVISFFNVECWQLAIITHDSTGGRGQLLPTVNQITFLLPSISV